MTVAETTLIFAGIPLAVVLAVIGIVFALSSSGSSRYRPDLQYTFTPVWYLSPSAHGDDAEENEVRSSEDASQGGAHAEW